MRIREHGIHYHVIARCNNRERLLVKDRDCKKFLQCLKHYIEIHKCKLFNYVIMPSHVHMMIATDGGGLIDQFMHDLCLSYSHSFNRKHGRCGHLWRHKYKCKVISDDYYALACMRYIDKNPVAAGIVKSPLEWPWSGFRHYAYRVTNELLTDHPSFFLLGDCDEERKMAYRSMVQGIEIAEEDDFYIFESWSREGSRRYEAAYRKIIFSISRLIKKKNL